MLKCKLGEIFAGQHCVFFSRVVGESLLVLRVGRPAQHRPAPPTVSTTLMRVIFIITYVTYVPIIAILVTTEPVAYRK